jgi:hypothetical protein
MDPVTTLTCEYIFEQDECIEYLKCTNNKHIDYAHIYQMHNYTPTFDKKKKVRKICISYNSESMGCIDLSEYTNLIQLLLDEGTNNKLILPHSITHLDLWSHYTRKLNNFPPGLIYLDIGMRYKHKLPELTKLRTLHVYCEYKYEMKLPNSLKHLTWHNDADIPGLPHGLTQLTITIRAVPALLETIPSTLTHLRVEESTEDIVYTSDIPDIITHLTWRCRNPLPKLHNKLIYLSLGGNLRMKTINLPNSITHLIFCCGINIKSLPTSLTYLKWGYDRRSPKVPKTLKYLIVSDEYGYICPKINIPANLKFLKWSCVKQLPSLSKSLHTLILDSGYNYDITTLPAKLTRLKLYCNKRLPPLPTTLITLELKSNYTHKLPPMPTSLTKLIISCDYKYINVLRNLYGGKMIYDY